VAAQEPRPAPLPGPGLDPEVPAKPAVLPVRLARDGSTWRIGTQPEVAWIASGTSIGRAITAAIPPAFEAYATAVLPDDDEQQDRHDRAVVALLSEYSAAQPWRDDDWSCIGGPAALVGSFLRHPDLQARPVMPGQDATPPGHQAL
jgi:hypothetical protein